MRLGATNAFWRTKKEDVSVHHVLEGRFPSHRQVQLSPGMSRIMERTGMERDIRAKERAD